MGEDGVGGRCPTQCSIQACGALDLSAGPRPVWVQGWVRHVRHAKSGLTFLSLSDGSKFGTLQAVLSHGHLELDALIPQLGVGSAVSLKGELVPTPDRAQDRELKVREGECLGSVEDQATYPMAPKEHSLEHLREWVHLRPRTQLIQAISRVRNRLFYAVHQFFQENQFSWLASPILTSADCEGAGETFRVLGPDDSVGGPHFFGRPTYLTVSGQLQAECYACALGRVYTFGPTFRAENSNTSRHLAEFWMVEPEIAFCDLSGVQDWAERLVQRLARACLKDEVEALAFLQKRHGDNLFGRLDALAEGGFARLDYGEAIEILSKSSRAFEFPVHWGIDLATEHERYLSERHVRGPVFVQNYPADVKAFYMRQNADEATVAAVDLLVPGMGEILGGSQREERLSILDQKIRKQGWAPESLDWYRDLRRYGTVPHAGFGLGFERVVGYFCALSNIREAIPFPRAPNLINC